MKKINTFRLLTMIFGLVLFSSMALALISETTSTTQTCDSGLSFCGTECVDLDVDNYNCGYCDNQCADGKHCIRGTCLSYDGQSCTSDSTCESGYCDNDGVGLGDSGKCFTPALIINHCSTNDVACQQSDGSCEYSSGSGVALADERMPGAVVNNKESATNLSGCPAGSTCIIGTWTTCWAYDGDYGNSTNNFCTSLGGTWTNSLTGNGGINSAKMFGQYGCSSSRPYVVACDDGVDDGFCCGDDKDEFYKYNPTYSIGACCNSDSLIVDSTGQCVSNICGDGVTSGPEECDNGVGGNRDIFTCPTYSGSCNYCDTTCKNQVSQGPYCGDGIINGAEECDGTIIPPSATCTGGLGLYGADFDGGTVSCTSCKLDFAACTCASGTNCVSAPSKPLVCIDTNTDKSNCGACGNICDTSPNSDCCSETCTPFGTPTNCKTCGDACSAIQCGAFRDKSPTCTSVTAGCAGTSICDTACTHDNEEAVCKPGAYCNAAGKCDFTCEFKATLTNNCIFDHPVYGCRPGDSLFVKITYRGDCTKAAPIVVDLATSSTYPSSGYTGSDFCNIQEDQSKSSMAAFTSNTPLDSTTKEKETTITYTIPQNFGTGLAVCENKNFTYFDVGFKGTNQYYDKSDININLALVNPICGDDKCMSVIGEDTNTCFRDCFKNGWETKDNSGWSLLSKNILHGSAEGISIVTTYTVDIKADKNYVLSYNLFKNSGCNIKFDFNGGECTSAKDLKTKKCFDMEVTLADGNEKGYGETQIVVSTNDDATNGVYFKGVKLKLTTGAGCTDVDIANLSLTESTYIDPDAVEYDYSKLYNNMPPGNMTSTGCCPNSFCWDGQVCQNSNQWMTNATLPGIWNSLNVSNWTDNHVNLSNFSDAISYRCVIVNATANEAQWVPSIIKYDWDFKTSGYCAAETDCFVNTSFNQAGRSNGCIHTGEVVSDAPYDLGQGNHYCYLGNWTTKSYIVATFLQNISEGMPYSLQCYDNASINYNLNDRTMTQTGNILSSCVLIQKESALKENVITGVVFNSISKGDVKDFIINLTADYKTMYDIDIASKFKEACLTGGEKADVNSNFTKCVEQSAPTGQGVSKGGLYVYYETNYGYLIFSDSPIDGLTKSTVWDAISGFFKGLFSSPIMTEPFTSINYTTNYDKIYVLRNGTVNVTALEEAKYDEAEHDIATIMYVKYTGTYNETNPLYQGVIDKSVSDKMSNDGTTDISVVVAVSDQTSPIVEQELIIKSQEPSGLWRYFTSILRTR